MPERKHLNLREISRRIAAREDDYLPHLDQYPDGLPGAFESELLAMLEGFVPGLVAAFNTLDPDERGVNSTGLALASLHYTWESTSGDPTAMRRAVVGAFLATETERLGMFRLHRTQQRKMAEHYEAIGARFAAMRYHRHAELAYRRAADMYRIIEENKKYADCKLAAAMAGHRARPFGLTSVVESANYWVSGYGYRPFKLLVCMLLQIAMFTALVRGFSSQNFTVALHACLVNFLNPLGMSDVQQFGGAASALLVVESYAGYVSMAVFFALLVRRW